MWHCYKGPEKTDDCREMKHCLKTKHCAHVVQEVQYRCPDSVQYHRFIISDPMFVPEGGFATCYATTL
jgi:hypothetical protein